MIMKTNLRPRSLLKLMKRTQRIRLLLNGTLNSKFCLKLRTLRIKNKKKKKRLEKKCQRISFFKKCEFICEFFFLFFFSFFFSFFFFFHFFFTSRLPRSTSLTLNQQFNYWHTRLLIKKPTYFFFHFVKIFFHLLRDFSLNFMKN